jgi:hypothetical protein
MKLDKKLEIQLLKYFKSFNKKDLKGLEKLFSNDIQIIDWDNNVKKKSNVLQFNKELFKKFKIIKVSILEKFFNQNNSSFACKISIKLDNKKINVVDLIYFNSKLKINRIIAYLR